LPQVETAEKAEAEAEAELELDTVRHAEDAAECAAVVSETHPDLAPVGEGEGATVVELASPDVPISAQTDRQLLVGLRAGSELHFGELYNRYFQRIYSFVYSRIRNHADAEEVVQETFTAVFRSFQSYRGTSSLLSWIYGIAKNTLNSSLRRAKTEGQRLENLRPEAIRPPSGLSDCNPQEHLNMRRYTEAIRERLESVSSWQADIFAMRHLENMSISEISARTHRSSDAIRSSLYRVKRLLFDAAELESPSAYRSLPPPGRNAQQVHRG
jgi:RNA polymerase sigma-70 factor (ECF subfamily)